MREIQADFMKFVTEAWGPASTARSERARRFLEEAVELAQACGVEPREMWRIFDRILHKKPGNPAKELGQAQLTLLGLSAAMGEDVVWAARGELTRLQERGTAESRERRERKRAQGLDVA